jgi:hypothetical protein
MMSWEAISCMMGEAQSLKEQRYLSCNYIALRLQSQLCLQSRIVYSSRLVKPLFYLVKALSTCVEQVTSTLTSSHGPLEL